ncbi:bifunctional (p)ppGpp synthetase/guanosine-3',5'-bis(diphosphate) 3'-pyrophosphohydrolase [Spirulina major CS-329]|uniref:RelA/SpoT family protein n=1 Tax=Spirulina TaxID=1154 RepID=UPI00233110EA|nr:MULTISPECIES: bifunctional (p)ppGpp synthetase/guanosine-3',5'-bis(diphosphate) 3'-pyrophosphohydrolase [Spirulina]MDB9493746.1 bifunctional (p)ppGpp synthetase/guanosine-3',5'-bis(diphosphate) 3'-pyrophosphohydrolase [Spirulina subsalsa CS-330]MDB9501964.1 bifunctional (p)ppGpp synthetase/guanosine-3',5'-bis(diphosphate) 3'-pyrophosphohydrolase [Spirulina major CS-329]
MNPPLLAHPRDSATLPSSGQLPTDITLPDWLSTCLLSYGHQASDDTALICHAFNFAYALHEGQYRKSGEPYIAHPVAVAGLLRDLGGDSAMIAAGFLHDVVEDTDVTPDIIEEQFGAEVRQLVEGVTKLSSFNFSSKTERQAENFRRMFLAMAKDIRVIIVKLADRLHNMRTLEHLKPEKQQRIAQETRDIFAPLANRLGIGRLKWELEDLCFKYLEPDAYRNIQDLVAERRIDREARIENVVEGVRQRLTELGIAIVELQGRPKHLYGIYKKMERQHKAFTEIYDIAAVRIITETKDGCYRALSVVHDLYRPIPGRFKDYIGLPKPNRYQSLHTSVVGATGRPLEVQIRTLEMHHIAEYGIAAHWKYKESGGSTAQLSSDDEKFTWLRQLLEWQNDLNDAQEYVENLKSNLFEDDVYVFTPQGDVVSLARGATAVDFAYRIHTEVGNHMKGARVNSRWSVLDTPLQNGDIVEIITSKNSRPSLDWLNFVVTPSARNRIRQWYKRSHRDENILRGRDLLEKEMGKSSLDALLKSEPMQAVAERCNYQGVEDLLAALGYGEVTLNLVVNRIRDAVKAQQPIEAEAATITTVEISSSRPPIAPGEGKRLEPIAGVEGLLHHIAGCCHPIPGESIIGVVTRTRGISIHRQGCPNVEGVEGDRIIPVSWNTFAVQSRRPTYRVNIQVEVLDRVGIMRDILAKLSDHNINVCQAEVVTQASKPALINLGLEICDRPQLDHSFNRIRQMSDVLNLRRLSSLNPES